MKKRDKTICLNMIVKNESHIICETLDNLHKIFDFDYWVISDTGSTDNTRELIRDYFKEKGVPGEVVDNEWKWFGESRTDALKAAYNKTDYLLIFDADDKIHGNLVLPENLTADSYCLKFKSSITYFRPLLINNRKKWKFKGVIHEVLSNIDPVNPSVYLDNEEYFVESRRLGNFNLDPLKYQKQAKVLEDAFYKEMDIKEDIGLANRYAFYCARSYRDAGDNDNAIIWFKKVINELGNWYQEKYCSCIEVGDLFAQKNDIENCLLYYLKSVEFDDERIEGIVKAINLLFSKGINMLAISLYNHYKNYNHNIDTTNRLFIEEWFYRQFEMDFRVSIQAYNVKGQEKVGYECCKKIINSKKFEPHTYLQTVWNLSLPKYKKFILTDNKEEVDILHQTLSEYIVCLDSNKFKEKDKENWNVVIGLWKFINNFNNCTSDINEKVKEIVEYSDLTLKGVSDMMYDYTFKTSEHALSIALFKKYKNVKVTNENREYYYKIRHLANISASYANDKKTGYECCKEIIINDIQYDRDNVIYNIQFYIKEIENDTDDQKIKLLERLLIHRNKIKTEKSAFADQIWNYSRDYILKYAPHLIDTVHKTETAKNSNKILIYTGYSGKLWNYTNAINSALGGSEKAVAFMSKELPTDYEIYISGDVQDEKVDNITYVNRDNLSNLLDSTEFHTIIISRYVSFFVLYPIFKCHKLIISAHDTIFLNNSHINNLSTTDILHKYMDIIDYIVVLTEWHKSNIASVHRIVDQSKFRIINNGIITNGISDELEYTSKKIKNSFIYTSRPERGLERLLELWPSILEKIPDATLNIATYEKFPVTEQEVRLDNTIKQYSSITFLGQLNEYQLKELRSKSEFWLYPTCFTETSCITSLEMLLSEVICVYYPLAGLTNTLGSYGIQVAPGNEIRTILSLNDYVKLMIKKAGKEYAQSCSWINRAKEWNKLIDKYTMPDQIIVKNYNLKEVADLMYNYTFKTNEHILSNDLYNKYKNIKVDNENKHYYYRIRYLESISACYVNNKKNGYECCKELIINDIDFDRNNVFYNMRIYIDEIEYDDINDRKILLDKIYIHIVKMEFENPTFSKELWNTYNRFIQIYHPDLWNVTQQKNKVLSAKDSKKILIYTGFIYQPWNYTYAINNALGGSEKAVAFMSKELPSDYEIYVSGDVEEEKIDNVTYVNRHNLHKLIETTEFHTIIVSRYISFFNLYPNFKCYKLLLSAHDVHFLYNLYNTKFNASDMLFKYYKSIDKIVTLTEWHKNTLIGNYKPLNNDKFTKINNGIITTGYTDNLDFSIRKIKNSFVFTSKPDRGLDRILEIWPAILEKMPDATLNVAIYGKFPESPVEVEIEAQMKKYNNIRYVGQLNEIQLRGLLSISEYWLYPNWRTETSCITAMEMLLCEVICIYFPLNGLTGLNDTLGPYGITSEKGKELETILNITEEQKLNFRKKGKEYALTCSWKHRANQWMKLITDK